MGKIGNIIKAGVLRSLTGSGPFHLTASTQSPCTGIISFYTDTSATSVVSGFTNAAAMEHYITGYNAAHGTEATYSVDEYERIKDSVHPFLKLTTQWDGKPNSVNWPPITKASYTSDIVEVQVEKTIKRTLKKATTTAYKTGISRNNMGI